MVDDAADVSAPAVTEGFDSWRTANFADRLSTIRVPTLAIPGKDDPYLTPGLIDQQVVQNIPDARLHVMEGASHYISLETPEPLARLLLDPSL